MVTHDVLVIGGAPVEAGHLRSLAAGTASIICADGGADSALDAGIRPSIVVGDMDSISQERRQALQSTGIPVQVHRPEKDQTDLELALRHALAYSPRRIILVGALGGRRLDHGVGNLFLLTLPELRELDVRIDEGETEAFVIWTARTFSGQVADYVSLVPVSQAVDGVRTTGLRYGLHGETLLRGHTRGISNEFSALEATISIQHGCLLVVHERLRSAAGS